MVEALVEDRPWEALRAGLEAHSRAQVQGVLDGLTPSESVRALLNLEPEEQQRLLTLLDPESAADLIEEVPDAKAADLVENLSAGAAASIMEELDSDTQADLLGELEEEEAEAILAHMAPEDAEDVRRLAEHEPESAGGLMMTEVFRFDDSATVGTVLRRLTEGDEDFERYRGQHPYVVAADGRLLGVVALRALLTSRPTTPLTAIMATPISVSVATPLGDLQNLFDEHPFLGLPVVDGEGRLIGAVSRTAVAEASLERAESDSLKMQGVVGDELRSMPTLLRARRRLSWLSINIVLNIIAASVIALYEDTIAAVIALAVFLPIVSDMSGCSGNQAVAVSLRELTLGIAKPVDVVRVWLKEAMVGVINGLVLGALLAAAAWAWKGKPYLGLVVGAALGLNTLIAVSIGGTVPLVLKRLSVDPAVASGPLLTTVTDMVGFFLVLSLASLAMPLLVM